MAADEVRFEDLGPGVDAGGDGADLGRLQNVPVELAVEIGRTRMTIGDALALGPGSVVTVGRLAGDPVDLLVNGRVIARGEVIAIDEDVGLRITEIAAAAVDPDGDDEGAPPPSQTPNPPPVAAAAADGKEAPA